MKTKAFKGYNLPFNTQWHRGKENIAVGNILLTFCVLLYLLRRKESSQGTYESAFYRLKATDFHFLNNMLKITLQCILTCFSPDELEIHS